MKNKERRIQYTKANLFPSLRGELGKGVKNKKSNMLTNLLPFGKIREGLRCAVLITAIAFTFSATAQTKDAIVVELHQAPGQFVNIIPEADENTTQEEACQRANDLLKNNDVVSLGSYGGYITLKFDHQVENKPGSDLLILGNGYYAADDPVYGKETIGGSIEPGIVSVGVGQDPKTATWYELAGSEYFNSEIHDFKIKFFKPESEEVGNEYVRWECSWTDKDGTPRDSTGYNAKLAAHRQSYWPLYEKADELTFQGGKLPNNAIDQSGKGTYWVQYRYSAESYGYADACPTNDSIASSFDIDWAVDNEGRQVRLEKIDFVRIQTGLLQNCGWIGETSTEVRAVSDLHLISGYDDNPYIITPRPNPNGMSGINNTTIHTQSSNTYYNIMGQRVDELRRGQIYICNGKKIRM